MVMKLRPYQEEAVRFLKANPAAGLFIDMGLGKTASTLHALVDLPKPILIVGPIRVIETVWRQEAAKWPYTASLTFSLVRGAPRARSEALKAPADINLVNPEL
jgi:superfamily II DNA or RNA helicase